MNQAVKFGAGLVLAWALILGTSGSALAACKGKGCHPAHHATTVRHSSLGSHHKK